ncbi:serine hydrolase domain-containing protein [Singulisphaera sp. PoT]|uniref:serine hydrolase domain-containing protein n=1 Tax=Singulisphaera sp. PoT TaxID=3411797 RepID=UPI003BF491E6
MNVRLRATLLALAFLTMPATSWADPPSSAIEEAGPKVDAYINAQMKRHRIPGLSLAVVKDGKIIKAAGYGLANVETNTPATPETRYKIASVSKPIVATAVMILVQEGKLGLEDKASRYLEDTPEAWKDITVRQLMNHTSGLVEDPPGFEPFRIKPDAEVIRSLYSKPLLFKPGAGFSYSNAAYFALGEIIRKASGTPWDELLQARVFGPTGMSSTRTTTTTEIVPQRARGYSLKEWRLINAEDWVAVRPSGAFLSTAVDLAKWDLALDAAEILPKSSLEQMWAPTKLSDGKVVPYGLGWTAAHWQGHRQISHNGHLPGFLTQFQRFPDDRLTVALLVNTEKADTNKLALNVAGLYVPELTPPPLNPIADTEPEVTAKVKSFIDGWVAGKLDLNLFTEPLRKRVAESPPSNELGWPGTIESIALVERRAHDGGREYRYRVNYRDYSLILVCNLDGEDRITGFGTQLD